MSARPAKSTRNRVTLDIFGTLVHPDRRTVVELRDLAATRAGASSQNRDLSLVLDHSLTTPTLTLSRSELRTFLEVACQSPPRFAQLAAELGPGGPQAKALEPTGAGRAPRAAGPSEP